MQGHGTKGRVFVAIIMTVLLSAGSGLASENPRNRRGGNDSFIERVVRKVLRWAGPIFNDGVIDVPSGKG